MRKKITPTKGKSIPRHLDKNVFKKRADKFYVNVPEEINGIADYLLVDILYEFSVIAIQEKFDDIRQEFRDAELQFEISYPEFDEFMLKLQAEIIERLFKKGD